MNPDSPSEIRSLLEERGLALKKRWGQNFLVNRAARERIVSLLDPGPTETIWEIGPGLGAMTAALASLAGMVIAFEVDRGMCRFLEESLGGTPAFTLVPGDFLDTWKTVLTERGQPHRVFGNLPYRSASLMLAELIEGGVRPQRMVFTVQKELGERMASLPGRKSYSSFSVLCQSCFTVTARGDLQPGNFYPAPEVVSSLVEMAPRAGAPDGRVLETLSLLARQLFSARRKTIRNNAKEPALLAALEEEGIDLGQRAEQIPPEAFVRLARRVAGPA
jgi:16S rRNA (adenine1518-N6/adenine1519-N6)-dimethyltransferase